MGPMLLDSSHDRLEHHFVPLWSNMEPICVQKLFTRDGALEKDLLHVQYMHVVVAVRIGARGSRRSERLDGIDVGLLCGEALVAFKHALEDGTGREEEHRRGMELRKDNGQIGSSLF